MRVGVIPKRKVGGRRVERRAVGPDRSLLRAGVLNSPLGLQFAILLFAFRGRSDGVRQHH